MLEHLHLEDSGSEPFTFCAGIDAEISWDDDVHVLVRTKGRDRLVYFAVNVHGTTTYTNLDTARRTRTSTGFNDRYLKVTDNRDGTLTITIQTTGTNRWFGSDGRLLFVIAGNFRGQFTVDHGGTPNNPEDDVEIPDSFVELKHSGIDQTAGRDFCEDLLLFTS